MNIALCGLGKAGKQFVEQTLNSEKYHLCVVLCREASSTAGKVVRNVTNINTPDSLVVKKISEFKNTENIDIIIDFSNNPTTFALLDVCCKYGINLVICPTNFTEAELEMIKEKANAHHIGVVFAPTLTVGINMLIDFVKKLSTLFNDFDYEIIEKHPKNKGKPTKTAEIIADSITSSSINIHSIRLNGYVGVHEVISTNGFEKITITHESFSRAAFVNGALIATNYIYGKEGFFTINEIFHEMITNTYFKSSI